MKENRKIKFEDVKPGDQLPARKIKMDRETYFEYNKLVNEINPLHFNESYAKGLGFDDIIVAGVYTFSFIPKMIADWIGRPGSVAGMEIKYIKPVYIDREANYRGSVKNKFIKNDVKFIECELSVEDERGEKHIDGFATIKID